MEIKFTVRAALGSMINIIQAAKDGSKFSMKKSELYNITPITIFKEITEVLKDSDLYKKLNIIEDMASLFNEPVVYAYICSASWHEFDDSIEGFLARIRSLIDQDDAYLVFENIYNNNQNKSTSVIIQMFSEGLIIPKFFGPFSEN